MNITYLLGAGASANALPLIKKNSSGQKTGLPEELRLFINETSDSIAHYNYTWNNRIIEDLKQIADKCIEFGTPDLFAKFLLETGDENGYKLLKGLLSIFFKYKQEEQRCFDFRALTFLTTISTDKKIPENVRVLSWNYDVQMEIAAEKLQPVRPKGHTKIQGFTCWPNCSDGEGIVSNPFLFHLNGIAGFNYSEKDFAEKVEDIFDLKTYAQNESLLSFAWENINTNYKKTFFDQRLNIAQQIATGTNILVIIGYSFPFFNRQMDQSILNWMAPSLSKIYYQDLNADKQKLTSQFNLNSFNEDNIVPIHFVDNYHIPFEL